MGAHQAWHARSIRGFPQGLLVLSVLVFANRVLAGPLTAAKQPIRLNLMRVDVRQNETVLENGEKGYMPVMHPSKKKVRSRALLFQQALDLEPGKPFVFDYPKWRMLENCGLFRNLSATTRSNDGQITTIISGTEVPSITFAPSVQLGASLENPEINGGVLLRDNNFRGLGERFELIVSAFKEGLEKGVGELPPSFTVKWIDGIKGRPNSITACWDEEYGLEDSTDLTTRTLSRSASARMQVMKRDVKLTFDGVRTFGEAAGNFLKGSGVKYKFEPFQCEVKPLDEGNLKEVDSSTLSGARFGLTHYPKPSLKLWPSIGVTHEMGMNSDSKGKKEDYQTLGVDVVSPNILIKETITKPGTKAAPPEGHATFLRMKLNTLLSRGAGRVPLKHFSNFDDPRYLRGYSANSAYRLGSRTSIEEELSNRKTAHTVLKADIQNSGLIEWGIPGVFLDAALFRDKIKGSDGCEVSWGLRSATGVSAQLAAGLSVKASGFRLDLGWPLRNAGLKPRLYLGPDID